mmetsp:Transcript_8548/g.27525  ORF Transcript_8548/g.27525 Transcript_8548/m.27525 type:complete len:225 (+) Transcript_8548:225-899(+)
MRPSAVTAASFPPSGLKASAVTAAPASEARSTPSSPNSPRPFLAVAARPPPRRGGDGGGVTAATRLPNREIRPPAPAAARQTAPGEGKVATGRHLTHRTDLLPPPAMAGEMAGDRPRHGLRRDNGSHSITSPLVRPTTASSSGPPPPADQCMSWHVTASCSCGSERGVWGVSRNGGWAVGVWTGSGRSPALGPRGTGVNPPGRRRRACRPRGTPGSPRRLERSR